jgi:hypothetical protein
MFSSKLGLTKIGTLTMLDDASWVALDIDVVASWS